MATIDTSGFDELGVFLQDLANCPDHVLNGMLEAGADILVNEIKSKAASMLSGPYYQGGVAGGVVKKRPVKSGDGRKIPITFEGTQHGERIGTIAFVNEHGTRKQAARPFVKTAIETSKGQVTDAEQEVFNAWIDSL